MSANSLLLIRKGLKAAMALRMLQLLLILNVGIASAVNYSTRTEDVLVSNANPPTIDAENIEHFLISESSSFEIQASSGKLRRLIGSSAPDCGHTCGACSPCKIQIANYECSNDLGFHAEACPVGYLCICHGKAFPIP